MSVANPAAPKVGDRLVPVVGQVALVTAVGRRGVLFFIEGDPDATNERRATLAAVATWAAAQDPLLPAAVVFYEWVNNGSGARWTDGDLPKPGTGRSITVQPNGTWTVNP